MVRVLGLLSLIICLGCQKFEDFKDADAASKKEGYFIKTLLTEPEVQKIEIKAPQAVQEISSMFADANYLYIGEVLKGIHVYDNRIPSAPKPLLFIQVPAMREFFIRDKTLVSDNGNDLISFNVQGIDQVANNPGGLAAISQDANAFKLIRRVGNIFKYPNYPDIRNIYFECPDSVGYVTEWELKPATSVLNCYR